MSCSINVPSHTLTATILSRCPGSERVLIAQFIDDVILATGHLTYISVGAVATNQGRSVYIYRMAEQIHHVGDSNEGERVALSDVGPEMTILKSSDARPQASLNQADATIRRLTTADMKPVETFRSMDVSYPRTEI